MIEHILRSSTCSTQYSWYFYKENYNYMVLWDRRLTWAVTKKNYDYYTKFISNDNFIFKIYTSYLNSEDILLHPQVWGELLNYTHKDFNKFVNDVKNYEKNYDKDLKALDYVPDITWMHIWAITREMKEHYKGKNQVSIDYLAILMAEHYINTREISEGYYFDQINNYPELHNI